VARFIDDIRRVGRFVMPRVIAEGKRQKWAQHAVRLFDFIRGGCGEVPVLLIDNVAEYYYSANDQEYWDLTKDFPNLAPPFPLFWVEHRFPKRIHSKEGDTDVAAITPNGRVGALIFGSPIEGVRGDNIPDGAKWVIVSELFLDYGIRRDDIQGPHGSISFAIDAEGRLIDRPFMQSFAAPEDEEIMRHFMGWMHPALLAISFLHCRNVSVIDNPVPVKLAKKFAAKNGFQPAAHKTLVIEPLKAILRSEGKSDEIGVARAMHICRGHFRDYREGPGLFGKYHQLVWTPSVVRGTRGKKPAEREIEVRL
jgi:hypothetical protein